MGGRSGQSTGGGGGGGGGGQNLSKRINNLVESSKKDAEKIHKGDIDGWERFVYKDLNAEVPSKARSTSEIKKEVGGYIDTSKIYRKEIKSMPRDVSNYISELGKKKVDSLIESNKTKKVSLGRINIVQRHVFEKPLLKAIKENKNKVVLFSYKGKLYLNDGNHRVAAAKLRGEKSINAVIENVE